MEKTATEHDDVRLTPPATSVLVWRPQRERKTWRFCVDVGFVLPPSWTICGSGLQDRSTPPGEKKGRSCC